MGVAKRPEWAVEAIQSDAGDDGGDQGIITDGKTKEGRKYTRVDVKR